MRITVKMLKELGACDSGVKAFEKFLNGRKYVLPTQRNLQLAADAGLNVGWLIYKTKLTVEGITAYGAQEWYQNGLLHRGGGPAVIYADGRKVWYENGAYIRSERP